LAARIREEQARQAAGQATNLPELYVDRDGTIGYPDHQGETVRLSRLTTEPMFGFGVAPDAGWLERQRRVAAGKLPPDAVEVHHQGKPGFAWTIRDEFGFSYVLWTGFDVVQGLWFAHLVDPPRSALRPPGGPIPSAHDIHLFDDGTLCLCHSVGCPDLETVFARSALWCRGVSCYRVGAGFPFSVG
jgi:hypothetical protein